MAGSICGRDAELPLLRDFVASTAEGAAALVLEGEAGVGKTTLWTAGLDEAAMRGVRVLHAQPAQSETGLSFAGIGDLLEPHLAEALEPLPAPQRRALSRALLLDDEGLPPDPHAIGVAVLNVLRALTVDAPVLVAVDDVQWLDPASAAALGYGARRLREERVGLMLARRLPSDAGVISELRRSFPSARLTSIELGPFDVGTLHQVVYDHLGAVLPHPVLVEIHEASGGNPFYALEIVRMLQRKGIAFEAGQPLPVPDSLRDLVHGRLLALPPESRGFLLAAAADAHPSVAVVEDASGVGRRDGLTPALDAGVVELDGERIRFTHPLLAAGAYETADSDRRRAVHARLAELADDPEARAWHLAASVEGPSAEVVVALDEAAEYARARGAPRSAALLLERSRRLTPEGDAAEALQRGIDAAYLHFASGDAQRAEAQLRDLIAPLEPGLERARALWALARIRTYEAPVEAADLFLQVVSEAMDDRELRAAAHEGVASSLYYALDRLRESGRHAEAALALAHELGDEAFEGDVLVSKLGVEALLGDPGALATAERALALQSSATERRILDQPLLAVAEYWMWTDAPGRAKETFVALLALADEMGDESSRPYLLFLLGEAESLLGELAPALEHAREAHDAAERSGQVLFCGYSLALQGLVHAELGNVQEARDALRLTSELRAGGTSYVRLIASLAAGHLEHALGAPERVLENLSPALEFVRREAIVEPSATRFVVEYVEALIELGRVDEAAELLAWYEGHARAHGRSSARARCARCRGLLAASAGRVDEALAAYGEALEWHARVDLPLDRGRTLLALGATQRRAKRRRDARATLESAADVFERIGAALWAVRARRELQRISGRAPTAGDLTPAEERVAMLVAEGRTNQEVADVLFLSKRTIDGHVSRILRKLGLRNRTGLGQALASRQAQASAASNTGTTSVSADTVAP